MSDAQPVVNQIDHVMVETEDPSVLFRLFTETLGLPVAWPLKDFGMFTSGGVFAGNVNLEFISFRQRFGGGPPLPLGPGQALFTGLAFEPQGSTAAVQKELGKRGLAYGEPKPTPNWTNMRVEGLLDKPSMLFTCEFHFDFQAQRRALREELAAKKGGRLGLVGVREVRVEVDNPAQAEERWNALLWPLSHAEDAAWVLPEGPGVRLVPGTRNAIQELVLQVNSLRHAREELGRVGLLGDGHARHTQLLPAGVQGLHLRMEE